MEEKIYYIYSENSGMIDCHEEYTLDLFVQDIIKKEYELINHHYSGGEFVEYHLDFFTSLAPHYLKARARAISDFEFYRVLDIFNEKYKDVPDEQFKVHEVKVDQKEINFTISIIEKIGIEDYFKLKSQ